MTSVRPPLRAGLRDASARLRSADGAMLAANGCLRPERAWRTKQRDIRQPHDVHRDQDRGCALAMRLLTIRTVVVATDLDPSSDGALDSASRLAAAAGAALHVVHVAAQSDGNVASSPPSSDT